MPHMDWKLIIENWRKLSSAEKARRRWESIPQRVARSMAFAGEPVSLEILEAEHALRTMPPVTSIPPAAD